MTSRREPPPREASAASRRSPQACTTTRQAGVAWWKRPLRALHRVEVGAQQRARPGSARAAIVLRPARPAGLAPGRGHASDTVTAAGQHSQPPTARQ